MIDAATNVFAVMGNPVSHSKSPAIFNRAFAETGYNGVYVAFRVTEIESGVGAIRSLGINGASITIPHKISILDCLDELDPMALRTGAVNTVINEDGSLKGYNSDWIGALKALEEIICLEGKNVIIIGAGGAARAVGFGVKSSGANLTISNRSSMKGERLAEDLEADFIHISDIGRLRHDILINTTSVGMTPDTNHIPVPEDILTPELLVMDIVYTPLETLLLKKAKEKGCKTINGLSMFIHQAAFQFELWTKIPAPIEAMKQSL